MKLVVDPRASKAIYVQIMDEVRRLIVIGELSSDDALPSVRQLAADLRLNHNTIVQAYRELEREGIVYVRRGQGTFVAGHIPVGRERARILSDVVDRALTDAHRNGISANDLLDALAKRMEQSARARMQEDTNA